MNSSNFQAFDNLNTEVIILDGNNFGLLWMNEAAKAALWTHDSSKLSGKKISSLLDKKTRDQIDQILLKSKKLLGHLREISTIDFDHNDVVRHPLVSKIVKAYSDQKND